MEDGREREVATGHWEDCKGGQGLWGTAGEGRCDVS